jgi:hypothetical protein
MSATARAMIDPSPAIGQVTVDRAAMDGAATLIEGRACWQVAPCEAVLLGGASSRAAPCVDLLPALSPQGAFRVRMPLDLTCTALDTLHVRCVWATGESVEERLAPPRRIELDRLGREGDNGRHLRRRLDQRGLVKPRARALLDRFESLGDNCEFGIYARDRGAVSSRPSLFRFGGSSEFRSTPRAPAEGLSRAIASYFDGLDSASDLELAYHPDMNEWIVSSRRYGFLFHSGHLGETVQRDALLAQQARRLRLSVRAFAELAADPDIVFVRKSNGIETEADMLGHLDALRGLGPARLLWIDQAQDDDDRDRVTLYPDGLIRARIARFADYDNAGRPDHHAWDAVIETAWTVLEAVVAIQRF